MRTPDLVRRALLVHQVVAGGKPAGSGRISPARFHFHRLVLIGRITRQLGVFHRLDGDAIATARISFFRVDGVEDLDDFYQVLVAVNPRLRIALGSRRCGQRCREQLNEDDYS